MAEAKATSTTAAPEEAKEMYANGSGWQLVAGQCQLGQLGELGELVTVS